MNSSQPLRDTGSPSVERAPPSYRAPEPPARTPSSAARSRCRRPSYPASLGRRAASRPALAEGQSGDWREVMRARGTRHPARHRPARAARARRRGRGCARAAPVPPALARAAPARAAGLLEGAAAGRTYRRPHRTVQLSGTVLDYEGNPVNEAEVFWGWLEEPGTAWWEGDDAVRRPDDSGGRRGLPVPRRHLGPRRRLAGDRHLGRDRLLGDRQLGQRLLGAAALRDPSGPRAGGDAGRQRWRLRPGPCGGRGLVSGHRASSSAPAPASSPTPWRRGS